MKMTAMRMMLAAALALPAVSGIQVAAAQDYPTRPITVHHSVRRRQRQRRRQPHHAGQDVEIDGAADHRRKPAGRRRQHRHRRWARKAAPDGYTLVGGGSGPVAANISLYKNARLRSAKGPRDDLAVRGLHHRRGREHEPADQVAQGTGRTRQGQSRQAQLRLGRHRQLAASGRRVFRAGHRHEAHATCPIATSRSTVPT